MIRFHLWSYKLSFFCHLDVRAKQNQDSDICLVQYTTVRCSYLTLINPIVTICKPLNVLKVSCTERTWSKCHGLTQSPIRIRKQSLVIFYSLNIEFSSIYFVHPCTIGYAMKIKKKKMFKSKHLVFAHFSTKTGDFFGIDGKIPMFCHKYFLKSKMWFFLVILAKKLELLVW